MTGVIALGVIALALPSLVPPVPDPRSAPAIALLVAGLVFYAVVGWRALRTVLLARRRADVLVVIGIGWLAAALVPALTMDYTQLGWWLGHGFEVVGILLVGAPVALDLFRAYPTRTLAGDLRGAELVLQEEAYLGSHVRALTESPGREGSVDRGAHPTRRAARRAASARSSACRPHACARSRSAGCCTTSASSRSRRRSSASRPRSTTTSSPSSSAIRAGATSSCAASASAAASGGSCSTTTSGSTAAAIRARSPPTRPRPRHPHPRGLRRLRRARLARASTATRGRTSVRSPCSATRPGRGSTPAACRRSSACSGATSRPRPLPPDRRV